MSRPLSVQLEGVFVGKYHFQSRLGAGAFGEVWLVSELDPQKRRLRDVAIKAFAARSDDRDDLRRQFEIFQREAERTAKARRGQLFVDYFTYEMYDAVVDETGTIVTLSTASGKVVDGHVAVTLFLMVMEFADGGSLGPEYRAQYVLAAPDESYLNHLSNVATALETLHADHVVHRDIKPSNLLFFRKENLVKVADLGIARALSGPLAAGIAGTPDYMSPEALDGDDSPARDRYALACTLYEIFAGVRPFHLPHGALGPNATPVEVLAAWRAVHRTATRPDAVRAVPTLLSVALSGVVKQMMAADPQERPLSLKPLIVALSDEKKHRFPSMFGSSAPVQPREVPTAPLQMSKYSINPDFRRKSLGESLYFIFLDIDQPTSERRAEVLRTADDYFGHTYSVSEVFGRHDMVLRVWSEPSRQLIEKFCEEAIHHFLYDNRQAIHVMPVEEAVYPGEEVEVEDDIDVAEVKVRLNEAQLEHSSITSRRIETAEHWLRDNNVYLRKRPDTYGPRRIKAYTLLHPRAALSQHEAKGLFAQVLRRLSALKTRHRISGVSAFRRQLSPIPALSPRTPLTHIQAPIMVKFIAPCYEEVIDVPEALMGDLDGHGVRTSTMLATKRLLIESDRIRPQ